MALVSRKQLFLFLFFLLALGGGLTYWKIAQGVNRTWDGGGTDGTCGGGAGDGNKWSCAANWSGDTAPTASDVAIFDGTSTKNATIDANISVAGISINSGYTGTITQSGSFTVTVGSSNYSQATGTFIGGSGAITVNGTYTLSGGTFTSTTGTLTIASNSITSTTVFTLSGGTFSHNNGTVTFFASTCSTATHSIDVVSSLTLYNVIVNLNGGCGDPMTFSVASGDTIIVANDFTQTNGGVNGAWEVQGNVIIGSSADGGTGTLTYTTAGAHTYAYTTGGTGPYLLVNNASAVVSAAIGTIDLKIGLFSLLAGSFTAPTGTLTIANSLITNTTVFTLSGGTFSHNNGTIIFYSRGCSSATHSIDVVSSLTLYNVTVDALGGCGDSITVSIASGDTLIATNNFVHTYGKMAGTWEVQGNYTIATTAGGGTAGITFTGGNNQTYTDQGGNESDGDVLINKSAGTVTLASGADWNATNQDVTITAGTLASATYNITTNNFTVNGGTFTGGSGTVTTAGPMLVSSGTFTGGAGNIDVNNVFTLSGGTFTSTSGTFEVGRTINASETFFTVSGGTFNHNNGTVKLVASQGCFNTQTFTVDVLTSLTLYNVNVAWTVSCGQVGIIATASGDTIIAANDFTFTDGQLGGTWEVQGNVIIASTADGGSGTLTMTGTGSKTYTYTASGIAPHLRINNAALSVAANTGTTALKADLFSLLNGTFTAPSGTFTVGRRAYTETFFTVSGGTFNHNNGTVKLNPQEPCDTGHTFTVDVVTSLTLYNVEVDNPQSCGQVPTVSIASGDTLMVANNFIHTDGKISGTWQVQGNVTIASGADGGTATLSFTGGNNQTYTDQGGNETDGDITVNKTPGSSVTLASNADWNATNQDVTITSGELNMGASYNLSTTTLTVATDGHLSNNGTGDLTLAGNVSNSGNIRFRSNGTCGGTDDILIRSSVGGTQRSWSGSGTFLFHDVNVQDQGGSAAITAYSSTSVSGNGGNWTFSGAACPAEAPASNVQSGIINVQSGSWYVR